MSIKTAIERSLDDHLKPSQKSYARCSLVFSMLSADSIKGKKKKSEAEERFDRDELKHEEIEDVILIENRNKAGINSWQIRDIFNDIGFNTDTTLADTHHADMNAVYNIGGYLIPFYKQFVNLFLGKKNKLRKLFLYKMSPGKSRLHIRLFDHGNGSWFLTSHVDEANWMNIFRLKTVIKVHGQRGQGDYDLGIKVLNEMLKIFAKSIKENKIVEIDADKIIDDLKK